VFIKPGNSKILILDEEVLQDEQYNKGGRIQKKV